MAKSQRILHMHVFQPVVSGNYIKSACETEGGGEWTLILSRVLILICKLSKYEIHIFKMVRSPHSFHLLKYFFYCASRIHPSKNILT